MVDKLNAAKESLEQKVQEKTALLSEKIMDLGNLTIGALVFSQFISQKEFSFPLFIAGIIVALACYTISYLINP